MKKILILICAIMMLCFTGCQPKDKKLSDSQVTQLLEKLAKNNPYRESNSIGQITFNPADKSFDTAEIAYAGNIEYAKFQIKNVYPTDEANKYRMEIVLGEEQHELFLTIVKDDCTELLLELPETSYKSTYVPDTAYSLDGLFDYLKSDANWKNGLETLQALFVHHAGEQPEIDITNLENGDLGKFKVTNMTYIGVNLYELECNMSVSNGPENVPVKLYLQLRKDPKSVNIKVNDESFPVNADFSRP